MKKVVYGVSNVIPAILHHAYSCLILTKLEFSQQFLEKNTQISNFMNIRLVGTELFHVERQICQS